MHSPGWAADALHVDVLCAGSITECTVTNSSQILDQEMIVLHINTLRCDLAAGCGLVRRILLAPASPPVLSGAVDAVLAGSPATAAAAAGSERMRAAVLFGSGAFGVFDLDGAGRLRPSAASPAACARFGRALDVSWVSLPG
jgi:hypothetical protein